MKTSMLALVLALSLASPTVSAEQRYATYEGGGNRTGTGGAKIIKNGIDYWTDGSPAQAYRILGIITDKRKDRPFDGDVVGSKSIAKLTAQAGGDAVIIGDASERSTGFVAGINGGTAYGRIHHRTTTKVYVIKYLTTVN